MSGTLELNGRRFGCLTVLASAGSARGASLWLCECDCGTTKVLQGKRLTANAVKSCGCARRKPAHNRTHGKTRSQTYSIWLCMKSRCNRKTDANYKNYGGRGIRVCDRWMNSFENFLLDMGEAPPGLSLDRYPDLNGNYEPANCRWATATEQCRNRRSSFMISMNGKTQCLKSWTEELNLIYATALSRIRASDLPPEIVLERFVIERDVEGNRLRAMAVSRGLDISDSMDIFSFMKGHRKRLRDKHGVECPRCAERGQKPSALLLIPQQRCRIDGYVDPRPDLTDEQYQSA